VAFAVGVFSYLTLRFICIGTGIREEISKRVAQRISNLLPIFNILKNYQLSLPPLHFFYHLPNQLTLPIFPVNGN
jgi:hypothetical protein